MHGNLSEVCEQFDFASRGSTPYEFDTRFRGGDFSEPKWCTSSYSSNAQFWSGFRIALSIDQ